jgi:DNA-directed RNA polymerase specialized sigma subunit
MVEHMQAKERLERIKNFDTIKLLLDSYKREISFWDSMVSKANELYGSGSLTVKLTEFRNSLVQDAESLTTEAIFMVDLVKRLKSTKHQKVIAGLYFQGKSLRQVASDVDISLQTAYRYHSDALVQLDQLLMNAGVAS